MASYNKHNQFVEDRNKGVHNLASHTLRILLTNTAPTAANSIKGDLTEISAGNGYTAGGPAVTVTTAAQSGGTFTLAGNQVVITASGGAIGPFRYVELYNDTPTSPADPLIAWWDYGSALTLNDGDSLTVKFSNANPGTIFTDA